MTRDVKQKAGFALFCVASLVVGWRALYDTLAIALRDEEYTHILMILPLSVALVFLEWRPVKEAISLNLRTGCGLLAIAATTAIASAWLRPDLQLSMRMLALVLSWIGAFVLCFGTRASRRVLFPLCFLLGLVPLPQSALNVVIRCLQLGSAWTAHCMFAMAGVPVIQDGVAVSIPGLTLHVAQECSSIRSSSLLLVTSIVMAQVLLRTPWRRGFVILLAIPLSVAKNGLRIFTIAMLGTRVDAGYLTGRLHHEGGVIFFAVVLLVLFGVMWSFRRAESRAGSALLRAAFLDAAGD